MKPDTAGHAAIGIGGTLLAIVSAEKAAVIAGLSTSAWMLWQLGTAAYDRWKSKK